MDSDVVRRGTAELTERNDMGAIPNLDRIAFFPGELLTADDLTTLDSNAEQLRWLHNRTMHNWGIAYGLNVQGARGATSVTVNPGFAVDRLGREIILSASLLVPIPAVPGGTGGSAATYYLVANYVDDANETVVEQRSAAACGAGGAIRLNNDPAIVWKTTAQLNTGIDVVLGQVSIQNCVLSAAVSGAARRSAAYNSAFAVTANVANAKDVVWTAIDTSATNSGFNVVIDTSSAGFSSTPTYIAQIVGTRTLGSPSGLIVDFVSVSLATATAFTLQVSLPALGGGINPSRITDAKAGPALMAQLGWQIAWMAVEG
jgi:hypothetical protein